MGMYWPVVICAIVVLIVLVIKVYWEILLAFFPQRERATEVHTVTTRDMWEISLYRYRRGRTQGEPVLLVHGAGANHHNFTEPEGASIVDDLVARGFDCWAIDTRVCRSAKPAFERKREDATTDDVLLYDLPAAVRYIRRNTGYGRVHWVGHSLGGMLLYAYALHWGTEHIASGTTLGSPIGFKHTRLPFKRVPWFSRRNPRAAANILRALIPILFHTGTRSTLFPINMKNLHARMRPGNLFRIVEDPMPKASDQLLAWAHSKTWTMLDGKLDVLAGLNRVDLPLFTLFAAKDPFVGLDEANAFFNALPNEDKRFALLSREEGCQYDYGHCDMAFGADGPRMVNDPIARWIEAHPIAERVRVEDLGEDDEPIQLALGSAQRAEILAGVGLVAAKAAPAPVAAPVAVSTPPAPVVEEKAAAAVAIEAPVDVTPPAPETPAPKVVAPPKVKPAQETKPSVTKKPSAKPVAKVPAKPAAKPTPKAAAKTAAKATAKSATKPATKAAPKATAKPSAKPSAKSTTKPAAKPASKPVAKAAPKPTPKPTPKPAAKTPAKPAAKPVAKPATKPTPKPTKPAPKPAPKGKATSTPRVTMAPAKAEKAKPSLLTKSAILSAGEALRNLESKKK